jgi:HD superfamily phosphohydrolase
VPDDFRYKIICDPVHGEIPISRLEQRLIDAPSFQRLRNLKQLGLASLVYPNASHSRFAHSLGVFRIMSRVIDLLVGKGHFDQDDKRKMRIAALLHDIGHYPYSHLMEFIDRDQYRSSYLVTDKPASPKATGKRKDSMSTRSSRPAKTESRAGQRYPDHEKIGQLIIARRQDISSTLSQEGIDPEEIASIIRGEHTKPAYNRLIHSSLDMDRMDYLVRDAMGTGVPYGRIDLDRLLSNLEVADDGDVVVSHKAAAAAEHFLVARYFMYKTVYMHKTTFGFEALLRHILFLMRQGGTIYRDGTAIESMICEDEFLRFHDGYLDGKVQECAHGPEADPLTNLCKALNERKPPKLLHEVAVLQEASGQRSNVEYALFCKDRVDKIKKLAHSHGIGVEYFIWEDPKDVSFESLGPFVPLSQVKEITPEETSELIRIRAADGTVYPLVEDQHSIIHHLSKLRLQMSRLYLVPGTDDQTLDDIKAEVKSWAKPN